MSSNRDKLFSGFCWNFFWNLSQNLYAEQNSMFHICARLSGLSEYESREIFVKFLWIKFGVVYFEGVNAAVLHIRFSSRAKRPAESSGFTVSSSWTKRVGFPSKKQYYGWSWVLRRFVVILSQILCVRDFCRLPLMRPSMSSWPDTRLFVASFKLWCSAHPEAAGKHRFLYLSSRSSVFASMTEICLLSWIICSVPFDLSEQM